uniref:ATP synthase subunit a n=1 Tax=Achalinus rufescens TaxID=46276 RepID=A0A1I9KDY0_9SAUR|nr:ATP synthase F0 subunit 6 [Achalinus rufescens]ALM54924.1 ATPase subunit 6 [Achalinus rufescens]
MNLNMFEQFTNPEVLFIPTTPISLLIPLLFIPHKPKLLKNRALMAINLFIKTASSNMLSQLTLKGQKWSHPLIALLILILLSNLLGLLPYTFTTTSQLSINMALAIPLWMATIITGLSLKPTSALAHMLPEGSPPPLIPFMILIESTSLLMRPIALGVRLTANITAGHLLMTMISSTTLNLLHTPLSLLTVTLLILLSILEMAVACIQAYVFILLVILYLEENT